MNQDLPDINFLWGEVVKKMKEDGDMVGAMLINCESSIQPFMYDEKTIFLICKADYFKNLFKQRYYETIRNTIIYFTNIDYEIEFITEDEFKEKMGIATEEKKVEYKSPEGLNNKYTFENYVTGPNNRFAYDIAKNIVDNPGQQFNPFFIYGGVGLGKTHLMQAIGHALYQNDTNKNIVYATGEQFVNDYISSMINANTGTDKKTRNEFIRTKYRNADILLIDDIQFLVGKDACQEQFFYTFNALFESGKQIVITSEKPPKDIKIDDRLKTRFDMGVSVDIKAPDFETRLAILRKKAKNENFIVPDDILVQVATRVRTNIRELEGVFTKLRAYKTITGKEIDTAVLNETIETVLVKASSILTSELIMQVVARFYNLKVEDLKSIKRSNSIAFPRQIAMFLCRESANMSFANIGKEFGGRDHSTVLHAYTKVRDEIKENKQTYELVEDIKKALSITD